MSFFLCGVSKKMECTVECEVKWDGTGDLCTGQRASCALHKEGLVHITTAQEHIHIFFVIMI